MSNEDGQQDAFQITGLRYRNILEIDNVSFKARTITAVVGPSGGGKTTLLKMLNRILSPDAGSITYLGRPIETYDPVRLRRRIVMLSQAPVIFPGTVLDNLLAGCRFAELKSPGKDRLSEALRSVKLEKSFEAESGTLSGGEKQRVALARILLMDPESLLLDEPSSALDEETERLVFEVVTGYARKREKTLIMVTHSEAEFAGYADTLVRITGGKLVGKEDRR